jgi:hypothetical protein
MSTLRERYFEKAKPKTELVTPEFLGEPVEIRSLSLEERRDLLKHSRIDGETDMARLQAMLIIATSRDPETKESLFGAADLDTILALPATSLDELGAKALVLNGLQLVLAEAQAEKN